MTKATPAFWEAHEGQPNFHFHRGENWGDPFQMERDLVVKLNAFRIYVGKPILIHEGFADSGHATDSAHYWGGAVDMHVVGMSLIDQWVIAERFQWGGVGLYPYWNTPGLHLDIRARTSIEAEARWWRTKAKKYRSLDARSVQHMLKIAA